MWDALRYMNWLVNSCASRYCFSFSHGRGSPESQSACPFCPVASGIPSSLAGQLTKASQGLMQRQAPGASVPEQVGSVSPCDNWAAWLEHSSVPRALALHAAVRACFTSEAELWRILCIKHREKPRWEADREGEKDTIPKLCWWRLLQIQLSPTKGWICQTQPRGSPLGNSEQSRSSFAFSGDRALKRMTNTKPTRRSGVHSSAPPRLPRSYSPVSVLLQGRNWLHFNVKQLLPEP